VSGAACVVDGIAASDFGFRHQFVTAVRKLDVPLADVRSPSENANSVVRCPYVSPGLARCDGRLPHAPERYSAIRQASPAGGRACVCAIPLWVVTRGEAAARLRTVDVSATVINIWQAEAPDNATPQPVD